MIKYVLSIKRINETAKPEWGYATYDDFGGPLSTGYPIFADLGHSIFFPTPEEAEKWFKENSQYINLSNYDKSSLAIRKLIFKTIKKVSFN